MANDINGYDLSRNWFNWCFENPDLIRPNHTALYFFCIEHCNRLGWKDKFGLPTTMAKEAIGIGSYNTYINTLSDLVNWGFIKWIEKSKNQYSSNIIAISKNVKATTKALDKAFIKHDTKQPIKLSESVVQSDIQSISSIDKPLTNKPITKNKEQVRPLVLLNNSEIEGLKKDFSDLDLNWMLDKLNDYKLSSGKKYSSDYGAICSWVKQSLKEEKEKSSAKKESKIDLGLQSHNEALEILNNKNK